MKCELSAACAPGFAGSRRIRLHAADPAFFQSFRLSLRASNARVCLGGRSQPLQETPINFGAG